MSLVIDKYIHKVFHWRVDYKTFHTVNDASHYAFFRGKCNTLPKRYDCKAISLSDDNDVLVVYSQQENVPRTMHT